MGPIVDKVWLIMQRIVIFLERDTYFSNICQVNLREHGLDVLTSLIGEYKLATVYVLKRNVNTFYLKTCSFLLLALLSCSSSSS